MWHPSWENGRDLTSGCQSEHMKPTSGIFDVSHSNAIHQLLEYLVILNCDHEVVYFNKRAEELQHSLGKPLSLGMNFLSAISPEKKALVASLLEQVKSEGLPRSSEAEFVGSQSNSSYFEMHYQPIREQGDIVQICVLTREITMQKVFEKRNAQLALELRHLIEKANAFIFGLDSGGYITDWNTNCTEVTQFDKSEVLAQSMDFMVAEPYREGFVQHMREILSGGSLTNYELQIRTRREPVIVLLNATPKHNLSGQIVGAFFVGQDITELVHYRQSLEDQVSERTFQLKEALRKEKELVDIKNKFVAIASHEFKIPLKAMESGVDALREIQAPPVSGLKQLDDMQKHIHHMRALLDDVLALEKSNVSRLNVAASKIDMVEFLQTTAAEVMQSTRGTHAIALDFGEPQCWIENDEKMLRSIFINIISNAVKFSPDRDRVDVKMKKDRTRLEVQVVDRGIGIPAADIDRIFTPFTRGLNTQNIAGTGLGLSIVKRAVDAINGDLKLNSEIGVGTTVTVFLPLQIRQGETTH
jgi:PAS domain S-box-containing protein